MIPWLPYVSVTTIVTILTEQLECHDWPDEETKWIQYLRQSKWPDCCQKERHTPVSTLNPSIPGWQWCACHLIAGQAGNSGEIDNYSNVAFLSIIFYTLLYQQRNGITVLVCGKWTNLAFVRVVVTVPFIVADQVSINLRIMNIN